MRTTSIILVGMVLFSLGLSAQVIEDREADDLYPGNVNWEESRADVLVNRIVDAATGLPIPGATMTIITDEPFPIPGSRNIGGQCRADGDGWARLDGALMIDGRCQWIVYDAPGYAPQGNGDFVGDYPIELRRGHDARIRVENEDGQALAGIELELLVGCGHNAASRFARSDHEGIVVFHDVRRDIRTAELWVRGSGVESRYHPWWPLIDPVETKVLKLTATPDIRGRIVDEAGKPVPGAYVGRNDCKRGPWVRTDEDGRFCITGLDGDWFTVHAPDSAGPWTEGTDHVWNGENLPLQLVLGRSNLPETSGDESEDDPDPDSASNEILELEIEFTGIEDDAMEYRVLLDRIGGRVILQEKTKGDPCTFYLPRGSSWEINVRDENGRLLLERILSAAEIESGHLSIAIPPLPMADAILGDLDDPEDGIPLRIEFFDDQMHKVVLVSDAGEREISNELRWVGRGDTEDENALPRSIYECRLRPEGLLNPRIEIRIRESDDDELDDEDEDAVPSYHIESQTFDPKAKAITVKQHVDVFEVPEFKNADGEDLEVFYLFTHERLSAWRLLHAPTSWSTLALPDTRRICHTGKLPRYLVLIPGDPEMEFLWIDLTTLEKTDSVFSLADFEFTRPSQPTLKVDLPPTEFIDNGTVEIVLDIGTMVFDLVDEGGLRPARAEAADIRGKPYLVTMHAPDDSGIEYMPRRGRFEGDGPWTIAMPKGRLKLTLTAPALEEADSRHFWFTVNGAAFQGSREENRCSWEIHGLAPGRHRLIVAVEGTKSRVVDFEVRDEIEIELTLNRR